MILVDEHYKTLTYWIAFASGGSSGFYEDGTVARIKKAGVKIEKIRQRTYQVHSSQLEPLRQELIKMHNECQEWSCKQLRIAFTHPLRHWAFETERDWAFEIERDSAVKSKILLHSTTKDEPLPEE